MNHLPHQPIQFNPIFKEKIWGGKALFTKLGKPVPPDKLIGESWEISALGEDQTIVSEGPLAGSTLGELFNIYKHELAGQNVLSQTFPLLIKFIDSRDNLSVQVHPDDSQARALHYGEFGKTECWYVIDAADRAGLIIGFRKEMTRDEIRMAVESNTLQEHLQYVPIKPGDVFFIPAGTVHAILGNTLIYEVQQSSDVTLRLYDWARRGPSGEKRQLHIEEAVNVVDTTPHSHKIEPVIIDDECVTHSYLVGCRYFAIEKFFFWKKTQIEMTPVTSFRIITIIYGNAVFSFESGSMDLPSGQTILIPSHIKDLSIEASTGTLLLSTFIPDLPSEIIKPLSRLNVSPSSIIKLGGFAEKNDLLPFF